MNGQKKSVALSTSGFASCSNFDGLPVPFAHCASMMSKKEEDDKMANIDSPAIWRCQSQTPFVFDIISELA
jgi:hypothetical protein